MEKTNIAVIGIGNILMKDEGVGCHAANLLLSEYEFEPAITIIDAGTTGTDLLPYLEEHDRIIILDAVEFEQEPGFIGSIENDDILARLTTKMSMHHMGITDVLSTAKLLDIVPSQLFLLGMQPKDLSVGMELTEEIRKRLPRMLEVAIMKLEEWGVKVQKK
ncbi:MAG TPA: hydrogenase maturation protease [Caldithrix abyssi]|uniref:Hydrogenase maturation protease n=1 Tax=Caldithrix abyssi TaxID=187145 RepID=A0A7V4TYC9_CALAY|nr:hydrogenase maturation protease [Caldithrix abyssi]